MVARLALLAAVIFSSSIYAAEVNVYSARKEALIKPALEKFTQATGIEVNLVTGKADALIARMATEGDFSPVDVLITTDVGRLTRAKQQNLLQAFSSEVMKAAVPTNLRDSEDFWYALTLRSRPIMYAPDRVDVSKLSTMESLTAENWKGRLCIRSSSNIYNQSLISAMLVQKGEEATLAWLQDFTATFARPPKGGDRDQIKAVASGQCDLAIANTYYLAGMLNSSDQSEVEAARKVRVFWPNQQDRGAHINISGAAIAKNAPNLDAAKALVEFMVQDDIQAWYATTNHEYPVKAGIDMSDTLKGFGEFSAERVPLDKVGQLNGKAVELMDKAGWQ